jgi:hypothetical protein
MAMALVGGAFLSNFLQVSFDRLASRRVADFLRGQDLASEHSMKLKRALLSTDHVLEDAEEKQFTDAAVRGWLHELKDAVYDVDDLLDKIDTKSKVKSSISDRFSNNIKQKTILAVEILDSLAQRANPMGLRRDVGENPFKGISPGASLVEDQSLISGRHDDKEAIINLLLSGDHANGNEIDVLANIVAIVGTAGIGKTFFAQQLYNDNMLKEHFNLQAWVCLSEELDSFKLTKTIVEAITSSMCDAEDKNLQITLEKKLVGRKFLLVLDDVCNKNCAGWEVLRNSFKVGAPGSR